MLAGVTCRFGSLSGKKDIAVAGLEVLLYVVALLGQLSVRFRLLPLCLWETDYAWWSFGVLSASFFTWSRWFVLIDYIWWLEFLLVVVSFACAYSVVLTGWQSFTGEAVVGMSSVGTTCF